MKKLTIKYPLKENNSGKGLNLSKNFVFLLLLLSYMLYFFINAEINDSLKEVISLFKKKLKHKNK